jgi:hypothetical protein
MDGLMSLLIGVRLEIRQNASKQGKDMGGLSSQWVYFGFLKRQIMKTTIPQHDFRRILRTRNTRTNIGYNMWDILGIQILN